MGKIAIILVVLTAIVYAAGQGMKNGPFLQPFVKGPRNIRDKLRYQPAPVPGFNLNAWLGPWYFQFIKAPNSWAIAEDFTDYSQFLTNQGKFIQYQESARNRNFCNKMTNIVTMRNPGQFFVKDLIGDNWSGKMTVVATDYKGFSVNWGCTKWSMYENSCDDPWVSVKTRKVKVSKMLLRRIEAALQNIFGISTYELTRIPHGNSCMNTMTKG